MADRPTSDPPRPSSPPPAPPTEPSGEDLTAGDFPDLDWAASDPRDNIEQLVDYAELTARQSADWYFRKRLSKRRWGVFVRIAAMVGLATAGALPIFAQIYQDGSQLGLVNFLLQPGAASILIVVAGFFILLDQFGGYTTGWIRYIQTGQQITNQLEEFRFQDQRLRLGWGPTLTEEQVERHVALCQDFVTKVRQLERSETDQWAKEFRAVLSEMNQEAKKEPAPVAAGALEIQLHGGEQLVQGWRVRINDGNTLHAQGTRKAVTGLVPGVAKIVVQEVVPGNPQGGRRAEQVAVVEAGLSTVVELSVRDRSIEAGGPAAGGAD
jgi:hypothetical protein